jgi:hypothetical protein
MIAPRTCRATLPKVVTSIDDAEVTRTRTSKTEMMMKVTNALYRLPQRLTPLRLN